MLFGRPLHEIAAWPAWEVRLLEHYLARQPSPSERIERAIAHLSAIYFNGHRAEGSPARTVADFLPYLDPWPDLTRYTEVDREILSVLGGRK